MGRTYRAEMYHKQEVICDRRLQKMRNYGTENCRFVRVMRMIADGAEDREILLAWPEMDRDTLIVYRKAATGQLSRGAESLQVHPEGYRFRTGRTIWSKEDYERLREEMFALMDAGEWAEDAAARLGVNYSQAREFYKLWRKERGQTIRQHRVAIGLPGTRTPGTKPRIR